MPRPFFIFCLNYYILHRPAQQDNGYSTCPSLRFLCPGLGFDDCDLKRQDQQLLGIFGLHIFLHVNLPIARTRTPKPNYEACCLRLENAPTRQRSLLPFRFLGEEALGYINGWRQRRRWSTSGSKSRPRVILVNDK